MKTGGGPISGMMRCECEDVEEEDVFAGQLAVPACTPTSVRGWCCWSWRVLPAIAIPPHQARSIRGRGSGSARRPAQIPWHRRIFPRVCKDARLSFRQEIFLFCLLQYSNTPTLAPTPPLFSPSPPSLTTRESSQENNGEMWSTAREIAAGDTVIAWMVRVLSAPALGLPSSYVLPSSLHTPSPSHLSPPPPPTLASARQETSSNRSSSPPARTSTPNTDTIATTNSSASHTAQRSAPATERASSTSSDPPQNYGRSLSLTEHRSSTSQTSRSSPLGSTSDLAVRSSKPVRLTAQDARRLSLVSLSWHDWALSFSWGRVYLPDVVGCST